ncbi:hypothetical protein SAMN06297129_0750 [Pseudooceanicola antarcticus]|uniref:Invasion protein IalB, involved in pathogenesis n=1 Tax=Pseudooceanicola antarcticus TaxID=1247613 RepID=A0A285HXZ3_9RHOB|nr:invasion associated locus B family protein [Pseudooceanicola antarcticus]PJE30383.1 hypothetical protein CVM39_06660 [Pseudooceanicola antarcticus]SNY40608.1 hypothetical protein SAMN06297129_0750 [Pseudooceanicola antarcticus]
MTFRGSVAAAIIACAAGAASAQQDVSENQVAAVTDWSVFEDNDPRECWAVSVPKETVNTRDGEVVSVRRSEIQLMAFYRPDASVGGQLAFTGGYPFAEGSVVTIDVDGTSYDLYTEGEWAWPASTEDDGKILASMKAGSEAVLTGRSGRGTVTKDTFSLMGFTAAVEDSARRCQ